MRTEVEGSKGSEDLQPLYAHTPRPGSDEFHLLDDHLNSVATLAERFAEKFGCGEQGRSLGLSHDLAKASPAFQKYLQCCYQGVVAKRCPHSDPSAVAVQDRLGLLRLCVQGHHGGLPGIADAQRRIANADPDAVSAAAVHAQRYQIPQLPVHIAMKPARSAEHLTRMCFSALVDADFLDTEEHFSPGTPRGQYPSISEYVLQIESHLARFGSPVGAVNEVRWEVQTSCRKSAELPRGFFRLTVPTGGGKTLASVLFGLHHAQKHGLDRVIVAIPFTSIIEQTADVYREVFDASSVLEHHSAVLQQDGSDQKSNAVRQRLAAENWDCPLVVTTNVQLFESLLADKPSKCRKLHNIARSVIILDEAQSLPPNLIQATTEVLGWMVEHAGCSVVFCTATQPCYEGIADVPKPLVSATEIVPKPERLFDRLTRVKFNYLGAKTHSELALDISEHPQVLAVLNTKADAAKVLDTVKGEAFYLSTWLCPDHRRKVLREVRELLTEGKPCRLISTQVIEAGVDVDFPIVLRAMAPLDSLVQAAGRCNRNGLLPTLGLCNVFDLIDGKAPPGAYTTAIAVTKQFVPTRLSEVGTPSLQAEFTRAYFSNTGTDREVKLEGDGRTTLQGLREQFNFPLVAQHSSLIEEETVSVVAYNYAPEKIDPLLRALLSGASPRLIARKLSPFSVSLRAKEVQKALSSGLVIVHESGVNIWTGIYDDKFGVGKGLDIDPQELMV